MARLEHLKLILLPESLPRRKRPGFGKAIERVHDQHAAQLTEELQAAIAKQQENQAPEYIDPALILKVQMAGVSHEEDWEGLGITILSKKDNSNLVLFSSSQDLKGFTERINAYGGVKPKGQKHQPYAPFISAIESIDSMDSNDRIGRKLQQEGITTVEGFNDNSSYYLDVELWDLGDRTLRKSKLNKLEGIINKMGGEFLDSYLGPSLTIARVYVNGNVAKQLLQIKDIAEVDLPPTPDIEINEILELDLTQTPPIDEIAADSPVIGVIDSGVNNNPLLANLIVGSIGSTPELGTADDYGHGTRVAGICIFGDLRSQISAGKLIPSAKICSAKVVNKKGHFDDKKLVPTQMRAVISELHAKFNCRIFVISLGDCKAAYSGGKVGTWAACLDELVRDLDILIIVSAGNRTPRKENDPNIEEAVSLYPDYLKESNNGIFEPANALNVLSVGSLAHGEGLDQNTIQDMSIHTITQYQEPSPFTRKGPGAEDCIKPDIVDFGGTYIFDALIGRLLSGKDKASAGVLTLHHDFINQLFVTGSGTSYSAPMVANKASNLLRAFPQASSNLLRALLVGAASNPEVTKNCLSDFDSIDVMNITGYGLIDPEKALFSDESRVTLYAEGSLELDHFAVFQIHIPKEFQTVAGKKHINVTLAFNPPVRHTRNDYAGVSMSFRLIRGASPDLIFDHYRSRTKKEGPIPEMEDKFDCKLNPPSTVREKGSLQKASVTFSKDITGYGDNYYLVIRCEGGWAKNIVTFQNYAAVVEISHEKAIPLYARLKARLKT